jgi:FG-GAP repeat protein
MKNFWRRFVNGASRRPSAGVCAPLCAIAMLLASAAAASPAASRRPAPTVPPVARSTEGETVRDARAAAQPIFRLGNAARPFGWSTAVGDFDRDGTPDVAVADHVGRPGGDRYAYRIAFSLSSAAGDDVTFESTVDAVTIRTIDVDHDNDLDIVVGRALGGDAVGVWLNDGHGHFTSADVDQLPSAVRARTTVSVPFAPIDIVSLDSAPRRAGDSLCARVSPHHAGPARCHAVSHYASIPRSSDRLRTSPRAPPQLRGGV